MEVSGGARPGDHGGDQRQVRAMEQQDCRKYHHLPLRLALLEACNIK